MSVLFSSAEQENEDQRVAALTPQKRRAHVRAEMDHAIEQNFRLRKARRIAIIIVLLWVWVQVLSGTSFLWLILSIVALMMVYRANSTRLASFLLIFQGGLSLFVIIFGDVDYGESWLLWISVIDAISFVAAGLVLQELPIMKAYNNFRKETVKKFSRKRTQL
ncbi:MAG: hypothetical protein FWG78_01975 [Coriobacteriia bacterium]|nr:hypothetical protein [Coriobacteriia bacterium]